MPTNVRPFSRIQIYGSRIDIEYTSRYEGTLCPSSLSSKAALETVIMANATKSTGFLLWLSSYCFGCIIQENINKKKQVTKYFILSSGETRELNLLKPLLEPL